jgi:hypothetical protein
LGVLVYGPLDENIFIILPLYKKTNFIFKIFKKTSSLVFERNSAWNYAKLRQLVKMGFMHYLLLNIII